MSSSKSETSLTPSHPPPPPADRTTCKESSKRTPNDRVWAHRISDLVAYRGEYWSPSMVKIADEQHTHVPTYQERVFTKKWQQFDEPDPRKLRIWPVLTVAAGVQCNDELLDLQDESLREPFSKEGHVGTDEDLKHTAELLPKLEQRIAEDLLPEILVVDDPENRTCSRESGDELTLVKYRRVYPTPTHPLDIAPTTGHLTLPCSVPCVGQGSHSTVYEAHLTLDERFRLVTTAETVQPTAVRVAAKISSGNREDLAMLEHEARVYNVFPIHLSEDWSGFNAIGEAVASDFSEKPAVPATAVVPKFYGYFVPIEQSQEKSGSGRPILLMEECGHPIDPESLTTEQRMICFAFIHRLSFDGFIQNSFFDRNILVQPGPLTHPPSQRSLETPSFRVVDFGRCRWWRDLLSEAKGAGVKSMTVIDNFSASEGDRDKVEAASFRKQARETWKELFLSEREVAKDTIFGKRYIYMQDYDKYDEGRLIRAYRTVAREWLFPMGSSSLWSRFPLGTKFG
ncbi:hypothetical protein K438DRAFT_1832139 [Mycena galopus ATCC 62051]|nr:hypothetical protein K438DRAFT_1832139 [Mycena galopus ATCC 62051]